MDVVGVAISAAVFDQSWTIFNESSKYMVGGKNLVKMKNKKPNSQGRNASVCFPIPSCRGTRCRGKGFVLQHKITILNKALTNIK